MKKHGIRPRSKLRVDVEDVEEARLGRESSGGGARLVELDRVEARHRGGCAMEQERQSESGE